MAAGARRRGLITDINVTPLVDIMLVLLITFMLTAHLIAREAIEIKLPKAAQGAPLIPSMLTVTLTRAGHLYLNGNPVRTGELRSAVRSAALKDPKTQVIIAGDKDVTHGRVVWVLDLVKAQGVGSFAIQIDPAGLTPPQKDE